MGVPAWVDVVLGGTGTTVSSLVITAMRDRRRDRRERTTRLAEKAATDSARQDTELREQGERLARIEGRLDERERQP